MIHPFHSSIKSVGNGEKLCTYSGYSIDRDSLYWNIGFLWIALFQTHPSLPQIKGVCALIIRHRRKIRVIVEFIAYDWEWSGFNTTDAFLVCFCFFSVGCHGIALVLDSSQSLCLKSEYKTPITIYALSSTEMEGLTYRISDISSSDFVYYNGGDDLSGKSEFTKTVCISENDQMTYRFTVTR